MSDANVNYNEFSDDEIKNILNEALSMKVKEKRKTPRKKELNNALIGTLEEFLNCFKIIGYDLDGNPVSLTVFTEKMEKSALDNLFMEEIGRFMIGRMGTND